MSENTFQIVVDSFNTADGFEAKRAANAEKRNVCHVTGYAHMAILMREHDIDRKSAKGGRKRAKALKESLVAEGFSENKVKRWMDDGRKLANFKGFKTLETADEILDKLAVSGPENAQGPTPIKTESALHLMLNPRANKSTVDKLVAILESADDVQTIAHALKAASDACDRFEENLAEKAETVETEIAKAA